MLQLPFKGKYRISQLFGENLNAFYKADGLKGHTGIDFACPIGIPILSACDGEVIYTQLDIQKGIGVSILSSDIFQYKGQPCRLTTIYWHLKDKSLKVKVGEKVKVGQQIALSGNTGQVTGPHLHFSACPLAVDARRELDPYNGYRGNVNPLLYLDLDTPLVKRIRLLQTFLNENGAKLQVDGKWGKLSKKALDNFLNA